MPAELAHTLKRHKNLLLTVATMAVLAWAVIRGKAGFEELTEKHRQIQRYEEENAALEQEVANRRDRIDRLQNNPTEQDLEIRKLNLLKQGETTFMLPEAERKRLRQQREERKQDEAR